MSAPGFKPSPSLLASPLFRRALEDAKLGRDCSYEPIISAPSEISRPIRKKRRAADWHSNAYRAAADLRRRYKHRADEIDAALADELAKGPDFARCHRGSRFFIDPPKNNLDRNFIARVWFVANMIERKSWACRAKGKHGGSLGRVAISVLRTMLFVIKKVDGRLYPSLETLAMLSLTSKQAVVNAIKVLERMDFITVHRRVKRIDTPLGVRVVQDSNAYEFHLPAKGLGALAMAIFCPHGSESTKSNAKKLQYKTMAERGTINTVEQEKKKLSNEAVDRWWLHEPLPTGNGGFR